MKPKGIIRKIDELGRLVIPKEIRNVHNISDGDSVEILSDGNRITVTKYMPGCLICSSDDALLEFDDKVICARCVARIKQSL